jgi:hypothetical protein
MYWNLAVLAAFVFLYSVFAGRLERTLVGGAITYIAFGMVSGPHGLGILQLDVHAEELRLLPSLRSLWSCSRTRRTPISGSCGAVSRFRSASCWSACR